VQQFLTQVYFGFKQVGPHLTAAQGPSKKIGSIVLLYPNRQEYRCSRTLRPKNQRDNECRVEFEDGCTQMQHLQVRDHH